MSLRSLLLSGLLLVACTTGGSDRGEVGDDAAGGDDRGDDGGGNAPPPSAPPGAGACGSDVTCEVAASTCCACPTFAVPATGGQGSCDDVPCPPAVDCPPVVAVCVAGGCALDCAPVVCDATCDDGFVMGSGGCLVCACASADAPSCQADADCVSVAADCCGCERGGAQTAVAAGEVAAHQQQLGCRGDEACPEVDVCRPAAAAACRRGACALVEGGDPGTSLPDAACGRPALPTCGAGLRCVLNLSPAADGAGVGVCAPAPT